MYPLKLKPVYKDYLWGGDKIKNMFNRNVNGFKRIAESWEASCHEDGTTIIGNGLFTNMTLEQCDESSEIFGKRVGRKSPFPLLFKLIDSRDNLSIQVHPDDKAAKRDFENGKGKAEVWYILDAEPDAEIIYGLNRQLTKEQLAQAINYGCLEEYVNRVKVKKGDTIFVPPKTIHAIGKGLLVAELSGNSNITYRVYDYNRKDDQGNTRPLHILQALNVANLNPVTQSPVRRGLRIEAPGITTTHLCKYKEFAVDYVDVTTPITSMCTKDCFLLLFFLEGEGVINYEGGKEMFGKGDTFLLPAGLRNYSIVRKAKYLKMYVPSNYQNKIMLSKKGFNEEEIRNIAGV